MKRLLDRLPRGGFLSHVLTMMTGTTVAQALLLAAAPVLTRIYTPADFGLFAVYTTLTGLLAIIVTGKYDLAILLPKEDGDAANLVALTLTITVVVSVLIAIGLAASGTLILAAFKIEDGGWLWLAPITVAANGIYLTLSAWNNRLKRYRQIAINRAVQAALIIAGQFAFGLFWHGPHGLILGSVIGYSAATLWWIGATWMQDHGRFGSITRQRLVERAKTHANLPRYSIGVDLLSYVIFQAPVFMLSHFGGPAAVGLYGLTQRVLGAPMVFISNSVGDVFRQRASADYADTGRCDVIFGKTFKSLSLLVIVPSIILFIIAPQLFALVFGEPWREAGAYVRILLPIFLLKFVTNPLSYVFLIAGKLKLDLGLHFVMLSALAAGFYWVAKAHPTAYAVLGVHAVASVILYLCYLGFSWRFSKGAAA